ncbi:MAG: tetratricopeptide repeat protein [Limisphaerales bacterium]
MLTPTRMLAKKNRIFAYATLVFAMAIVAVGCSPPGPRALLKGKKLLDRGDYADAVEQLKTATSILATNAAAWNYYGVALEHAGQLDDASAAYQNALRFDRDLDEAHYNLGCLYRDENKLADAKTEFTTYILRRGNAPEGWFELGDIQLRDGEPSLAERSFSTVLSLSSNNAPALNGLGLTRLQRNKPRDAADFFAVAIQNHPDFAPAILNLATVDAEYLHDNNAALANYRKYLDLTPKPAQWDAVNVLVQNMEQMPAEVGGAPAPAPTPNENERPSEASATETRPGARVSNPAPHPSESSSTRPQPTPRYISNPPPETVRVEPQPGIVPPNGSVSSSATVPLGTPRSGMARRLSPSHSASSSASGSENYASDGVTPLPPDNGNYSAATASRPKVIPPAPPSFPRYLYLSPRKPSPGDRQAATHAFVQAQEAQQNHQWAEALDSYGKATRLDSSWFEAQYNCGVLAFDLQDYPRALTADEMALAIQPRSSNARYNFALALKASGYVTDAEIELKKVVAADPDNVRAHLALGNLYAQQYLNPDLARPEYLKVLSLDPHTSSATDIEFWLSANPQ